MGGAGDPAPLPTADLAEALERHGTPWRDVTSVAVTGSTNADLAADLAAPEGRVLVADLQTAGRGRLGRTWQAPPGTALTFSVVLRPAPVPVPNWSWVPLIVGLAVRAAVIETTKLEPTLKWPNDLLLAGRKFGGILCEVVGPAVIVGVGLNVSVSPADLPTQGATSLSPDASVDRVDLLAVTLRQLADRLAAWRQVAGDVGDVRAEYLRCCDTLGREVRVETTAGVVTGFADDVDLAGRLIVGGHAFAAGDVTHVRPAGERI